MTQTARPESGIDRRTFLAVSTAALATPAMAGRVAANQSDEVADWLADAPNYDGDIADERENDEVRVTVGVGNGFAFDPPAVRVDPGTIVVWEWSGEGGGHNVAAEEGAFESDLHSEAGASFEHTFEEPGTFRYACTPHISMGMKGAVVVGDAGSEESGGVVEERAADSGASRTTVAGAAVAFLLVLLSPFGLWFSEEYLR